MRDTYYGLTRIVLHNSYMKAMTVGFETEGHSNASGGNGAGKTSALTLIPIFYGAEPNSLVSKVSGKLSFVDYYLPHQSSALIFEHRREDGYRLVVITRYATGARSIYRFVKGSLAETFLHEDIRPLLNEGRPMIEIFTALSKRGIDVSRQIENITEYRAIIQNDKRLLRRPGGNQRRDTAMAREYCIGGPDSHMCHLDRMSYSVLKRDDMFNRLQQMIAETQFGDIHIEDKPAYLRDKSLIDDIASLRSFSAAEKDIRECVGQHGHRQHLLDDIDQNAALLSGAILQGKHRQENLSGEITQVQTQLTVLIDANEEEHRLLLREANDLETQVEQLDKTIDRIHTQHNDWIEQDITQKKADYGSLDQHIERRDELGKTHALLTSKVANLDQERKDAIAEAEKAHARREKALERQQSELKEKKYNLQEEQHARSQQLLVDRAKALDAFVKGGLSQKLGPLTERVGELRAKSQAPIPTQEENDKLSYLDSEVQQLRDQEAIAKDKRKAAQDRVDAHQLTVDQGLEAWEQARKNEERAREAQERLVSQLNPEDGSLLAELRQLNPEWAQTIGRIINPELLKRKDLEPDFEPGQETLYGWSLALSKLEPVEAAATEAVIRERLDRADSMLRNALEEVTKNKQACDQHDAKNRELNELYSSADHMYQRLGREAGALQTRYDDCRRQNCNAALTRQKEAKRELAQTEQAICNLEESIANGKREIEDQFDQQQIEIAALAQTAQGGLLEQLGRVKQQLDDAQKDYGDRLSGIEERFSEQCQREGVDSARIKAARTAFEKQAAFVEDVQGYGPLLAQYDAWFKDQWSTLREKQERLHLDQLALSKARQAVKDLEERFKAESKSLKETLSQKKTAHKTLSDELVRASTLIEQLPGGAVTDPNDGDLSHLTELLQGLLNEEHALKRKLLSNVDRISNVLREYSESKIHKAWVLLLEQRRAQTGLDQFENDFKLQQPVDFGNLIDELLPDIRSSLFEEIRSVGDSLSRYHGSLKLLNDEVTKVSRHLRDKINTNQRIDSLSDIQLHITSKVVEGDYWDRLTFFNQKWIAWREQRDQQLPSDQLMLALTDANNALQSADIKKDLKSLIGLKISVVENGRTAMVTNSKEFDALSSNGLSYLAIIVIFIGMARYLCPNPNIALHWPVDELANLSPENVAKLFEMFDEAGLYFFSAFPSTDPNLLKFFKYRTLIHRNTGIRRIAVSANIEHNQARERMKLALHGTEN